MVQRRSLKLQAAHLTFSVKDQMCKSQRQVTCYSVTNMDCSVKGNTRARNVMLDVLKDHESKIHVELFNI